MTSLTRNSSLLILFITFFGVESSSNFVGTTMSSDLINLKNLRLQFITWNVAVKQPEQNLHLLLNLSENKTNDQILPDMYIIGLQEVKSQIQDMVANIFVYDDWTKAFSDILKNYDYINIGTVKLVGIIINVYSLKKHIQNVRLIEHQWTRTGLYGLWGNKGAVSIRMNLYGINVCFVNTHLPPFDEGLQNRIDDYETIIKTHTYQNLETSLILYHDYIFWIGDLNFRLSEGFSAKEIAERSKKHELESLLKKDQLNILRNNQVAFSEFQEEKITFAPTYKYEFGTQNYDLKRRPSWTDRILYKVNKDSDKDNKLKAIQLNYQSHPFYVQSDHKPVSGAFDISIKSQRESENVELQVSSWYTNKENSVTYRFLGGYEPQQNDYIALFKNDFDNIMDYISYEYVKVTDTRENLRHEHCLHFSFAAARNPGVYQLIYFSQKQSALSILGISSAFNIEETDTSDVQICS